jgi:hypothetical protein
MSTPHAPLRIPASKTRLRQGLVAVWLLVWLLPATVLAAGTSVRELTVSYQSASAIYLDGGRQEGLAVGSRLEVRRGGVAIGMLEVAYVADHSASCRVVSQRQSIQTGDVVVLLTPVGTNGGEAPTLGPQPAVPEPLVPRPVAARPLTTTQAPKRPRTKISGVLSYGYQQFADASANPFDYTESTGRLSLRVRNLNGLPLDLRVRGRGRQVDRTGFGLTPTTGSTSNRLYELSLSYTPPEGRFAWSVGRLGASPFVGIGYLDGALGQFQLSRRWYVGGFAGSRPEVTELGLASAGTKYGGYLRFSTPAEQRPAYAEVVLAGVGEYVKGGEVSREYVSLESRFGSGTRWSVFQRLEVDLNRGWRQELSGSSTQISNASLSATYHFTKSLRGLVTYDQHRNYLTFETRPLPEDVFNRFLREGARASLEWEGGGGWNASVGAGSERDDSGSAPTTSATAAVYQTNLFHWNMLAGFDVTSYSGGVASGYVAGLRFRRYFQAGHDLGLTFGASQASLAGDPTTRQNQWVRLSGTWQLPFRLYLLGEYEYDTGDDLRGQRYTLEMGYQF